MANSSFGVMLIGCGGGLKLAYGVDVAGLLSCVVLTTSSLAIVLPSGAPNLRLGTFFSQTYLFLGFLRPFLSRA